MLRIRLVAVGSKMPSWVDQGVNEYARRISGTAGFELKEIPALRRGKNADLDRVCRDEELKIREAIPKDYIIIALDRLGKSISTKTLSENMLNWMNNGRNAALVIGGPEGLSHDFISAADLNWSLSAMTFAHPVARIMVAEQIYRGFSIIQGSPYHR